MFDGWPEPDFAHAVPDDGFEHVWTMECACHPFIHVVPGLGGAVCHRRLDLGVPDTVPAEWVAERD
jgi:hypothetical protein